MPAKMISEMPLPMPRSVICSPSHMMKAVPVVSVIIVMRRKPQPGCEHDAGAAAGAWMLSRPTDDEEALEQRQHDRAVARVLVDLAPPVLAFLLQLLEGGITTVRSWRMMLALMYGMMPSAKIEKLLERAAREHVEEAEDVLRGAGEELRERLAVDARRGDVARPADRRRASRP